MEFFNRFAEISKLESIWNRSFEQSQMTVISGRRRIGKTRLILEFFKDKKCIYLFVTKKSKELLTKEFFDIINDEIGDDIIGYPENFNDIFQLLFKYAKKEQITVIVDEIQNFITIDNSIFSDLQKLWDLNKYSSKLNLILSGSVYSLIYKIFQNSKEPLFGRANHFMTITPFSITTVLEILKTHNIFSQRNLLEFYILSGGVPKYIEYFIDNNVKNGESFIENLISKDSFILSEGKNLFIEEFGKEYSTYFTILQLIAQGNTSRAKISSFWNGKKELGGFFKRLDTDFNLISKSTKISKKKSKDVRYQINDYFLIFWFRFIYKNSIIIESGNIEHLKVIIKRDWTIFLGKIFEKFIFQLLQEKKEFSYVGSWWDRKGENEIDVVAIDEINKILLIGECKLQKNKIDLSKLKKKSAFLIKEYYDYKVKYKGFYPEMILE